MRAADEMPARKVVRSILAPPAIAEITARAAGSKLSSKTGR
jgi:hypothetical protein